MKRITVLQKYKLSALLPTRLRVLATASLLAGTLCVFAKAPAAGVAADTVGAKTYDLEEVVVKKKRDKYSKRNNPAVDLIRRVRDNREQTDARRQGAYSYDSYTKTVLGLNDFNDSLRKNMRFMERAIDTAAWSGKRVMVLSLKEKSARRLYTGSPSSAKEVVHGRRSIGVDQVMNQGNVHAILDDVVGEVDLFAPDIMLMQNKFVSPLSRLGEDYYKYRVVDTVMVAGQRCVDISFAPHNPESFSFNGDIFVAWRNDSVPYVARISMRIPKKLNLNYVKNLHIAQNYSVDSLGYTHKTLDDLTAELQVVPGSPEFYARRTIANRGFSNEIAQPDSVHLRNLGSLVELDPAHTANDGFWEANRLVSLSAAERSLPGVMVGLRGVTWFRWLEKALMLLQEGYVKTNLRSSRFDFGPVNTLVSYNTAEGVRFRVGGMTTANLSRRLFGRGYVAYGLRDHRWKYEIEGEWSFADKLYHSREFARHSLLASHSYDLDHLGQHYLFTNSDNIFLSLKRRESYLVTYRRLSRLEYLKEWDNHFSLLVGLRYEQQYPTRWVPFSRQDGSTVPQLRSGGARLTLRYAPDERFSQGRSNRAPINMNSPVVQLTHEYGPRGLAGMSYTTNMTELSFRERFWFSSFGYTDFIARAAKIWSRVEFTSLLWPNANLSYTIQPESYSLMNPMEFATDEYLSWDMTYYALGALFNRIPLLNRLKLREVVTFKGMWGHLTPKNDPARNPSMLRFPAASQTTTLNAMPYMEAGVGIENILTVLRVDYVWRLTYRGVPGIDKSGVRVSLHFSF